MFPVVARLLAVGLVCFGLWKWEASLPFADSRGAQRDVPASGGPGGESLNGGGESTPGHHHEPHHGGVVGMAGDHHLEALAFTDGRILAYVSSFTRDALPHRGLGGTVSIYEDEEIVRVAPLQVVETLTGPGLEARVQPLGPDPVLLEFAITRDNRDFFAIEFQLPVAAGGRRAGGAVRNCRAPSETTRPLCTLDFDSGVVSILASPARDAVVVSTGEGRPSLWAMPTTQFRDRFRDLPDTVLKETGITTVSGPALAIRPDGREAVVGMVDRLIRYVLPGAAPYSFLPVPQGGAVLATWSADARRILLAGNDGNLMLVNVVKAQPVRELALGVSVTSMTFTSEGRTAVVARSDGVLSIFDFLTADPGRDVPVSTLPLTAVQTAAGAAIVGGEDAKVRRWDLATVREEAAVDLSSAVAALAISPDLREVAVGMSNGEVVLLDAATLNQRGHLPAQHDAEAAVPIRAISWTPTALVVGDERGRVSVWSR